MKYEFTDQALEGAKELGISIKDLSRMLDFAAPVSHDCGNRRYENFIFDLDGFYVDSVSSINAISCTSIPGYVNLGEGIVQIECPHCQGYGCTVCVDNGHLIIREDKIKQYY